MHLADSQAGSTALGLVIWIVLIALYWSPTIVGMIMRKRNLGVIFVLNFFGGFVFTWIWAWVKVVEKPQQPTIVFAPPGYGQPYGFQPPPVQPPMPPRPQPQAKTEEW